jgi:hypothetical protein
MNSAEEVFMREMVEVTRGLRSSMVVGAAVIIEEE